MGQSGSREDGEFLPSNQRIKSIYRRYASLNKAGRIVASIRIHRASVDGLLLLRNDVWALINRAPESVKNSSQKVPGNRYLEALAQELHPGLGHVQSLGALKSLDQSRSLAHFQNIAHPDRAVWKTQLHQLAVFYINNLLHQE